MFEVSRAKRAVLEKLADGDWTPTALADELEKSPSTIYNHLDDLHRRGVVTKRQVAAKTRPETEYSLGDGFLQYVSVLPEGVTERTVSMTPEKRATLQIWNLPQAEFHPFVEEYWWAIRTSELDYTSDIVAVGVYGSVARGTADEDSDIDFLVVTSDAATKRMVTTPLILEREGRSKAALAEVYSVDEYRESTERDSDFLDSISDELHPIYDPDGLFRGDVP